MIRIKRFRPSCLSGLNIHICKNERGNTPLPGIQGVSLPTCIICGHEAGTFYRNKDGEIEYRE